MARRDAPTYVCDATGCKSTCSLSPTLTADQMPTELTLRGWLVRLSPVIDKPDRHFCPGCKSKIESNDTE